LKEKWMQISNKARALMLEDYPQLNLPHLQRI